MHIERISCRPLRASAGRVLPGCLVLASFLASCSGPHGDGGRVPVQETSAATHPETPATHPETSATQPETAPTSKVAESAPSSGGTTEPAPPGEDEGGDEPTPTREALEITFVGDVMFGRWREDGLDPIDYEGQDVLALVHDLMAADLTVANLETPLVYELPARSPYGTRLRFAASPAAAEYLVRSGIDVVSLANNHSFDMRMTGLLQTPRIVRAAGLIAIGVARTEEPLFRVETIDVQGWKIGFLAATSERNGPQRAGAPELPYVEMADMGDALAPVIRAARADHDLIIAFVHWGVENQSQPHRWQVRAGRAMIDAGADAVVGHHPHVLQPMEQYRGGFIAYSIGNFLFDNARASQQLTGVLRLRFRPQGRCIERAVLHPTFTRSHPTHHPRPATRWLRHRIHKRIIDLSAGKPFETRWISEGRDVVLARPPCDRLAGDGDPPDPRTPAPPDSTG